jgi:biopolymer transport protein ExbD
MIKLQDKDDNEGLLRDLAPDLTPLVDIIFILIVFLILTANPAIMEIIVDLPQKGTSELEQAKDTKSNNLQILSDGQLIYNDQKIDDIEKLRNILGADYPQNIVEEKDLIVAGDKQVKLENFLEVLSLIEELEIKNARILMGDDV